MGVPLFFAVNGFLILSKNVDPRKHILKTIRLYILTICWSFITVLSLILINGDKYSIIEFIKTVVFLKIGTNNHLWFMFVLVSIYLIVPVIKLAYDHKDRRVIYFLVATVFLFSFGTVCLGWVLNAIKLALGYNIVYDGRVL